MLELFHAIFIHLKFSLKTRRCVRKARSLCHVYHLTRKSLSKMQARNEASPFQTLGLSIPAIRFVQSTNLCQRPAGIQQLRKLMMRYKTQAVCKPSSTTCRELRSLPALFSPPTNKHKGSAPSTAEVWPFLTKVPSAFVLLVKIWNKIEEYLFSCSTAYYKKKEFLSMSLLSGTFLPLHRASETEASYYNPTCLIKSKITSQDYFF